MKSLFPAKVHSNIYLFALCLLVIAMPLSKFLMSVAQFTLLGNWILEGELKQKFISFFKNKAALVLSSLILMHLLGLIYTADFEYALKDIRIKAPLLLLPLILSTSKPLAIKQFHLVLKIFVAAVFTSSMVSIMVITGFYKKELLDIRGASVFISHIRFALLICVSFFIALYFFKKSSAKEKIIWLLLLMWWPLFLFIIQSMTGISVLILSSVLWVSYYHFSKKTIFNTLLVVAAWGVLFFVSYYFINKWKHDIIQPTVTIDKKNLPLKTSHDNYYWHDTSSVLTENGNLVWVYVSDDELKPLWNQKSKTHYDSIDKKGNKTSHILVRFLASKGLKKDADALNSLTQEEIIAIENGITNYKYMNVSAFKKRIYETLWEIDYYNKTHDAGGHSLTQRFEYWKTAIEIIKQNVLLGVGAGDIKNAFDVQYEKSNSLLSKEWRLRSHNQYLSIAVAFGVIGLIWFLITLFYPAIKLKMFNDNLYFPFFAIVLISFFTEDTLETQAGVTFYAFLNAFFLFVRKNRLAI